ncbi:MAG: hypothetical protein ACRD4R_11730 [Candidatus Acidiferrales bacterium]
MWRAGSLFSLHRIRFACGTEGYVTPYPIDERKYAELRETRDRMVRGNPYPNRVRIANPFLPWIGRAIRGGAPGIYFVGIATRSECASDTDDYSRCLAYSEEVVSDPEKLKSAFWRYINEITNAVFGKDHWNCTERIGWSNQFKIGVIAEASELKNPEGFYEESQTPICSSLLKTEIAFAAASPVVILGDCPVTRTAYPVGWDEQEPRHLRIWTRVEGGRPVIFGDHPEYLRWKKPDFRRAHIEAVASKLRRYFRGFTIR